MTLSEKKKLIEGYVPDVEKPDDFRGFWLDRQCGEWEIAIENKDLKGNKIKYCNITIENNGKKIKGRMLLPDIEGKIPLCIYFHDCCRGVRGWHWLSRFAALGMAVATMEYEPWARVDRAWDMGKEELVNIITDAIVFGQGLSQLKSCSVEDSGFIIDTSSVSIVGDGLGGSLSIATGAMVYPGSRVIVYGPSMGDIKNQWKLADDRYGDNKLAGYEYLDMVCFAGELEGELLLGTGLGDIQPELMGQGAIYNSARCEKRQIFYLKHGRERVNGFENEILNFL